MSDFVYVMRYGDRRHKIGFSCDPVRRMRELEEAQGIIRVWERPGNDARKVEHMAHCLLRDYRDEGEIFLLADAAACAAVELAIAIHDEPFINASDCIGALLPEGKEDEAELFVGAINLLRAARAGDIVVVVDEPPAEMRAVLEEKGVPIFTAAQACEQAGVSESTMRRWFGPKWAPQPKKGRSR